MNKTFNVSNLSAGYQCVDMTCVDMTKVLPFLWLSFLKHRFPRWDIAAYYGKGEVELNEILLRKANF